MMRSPRRLFEPGYWLALARRVPELPRYLSYRLGRSPYGDYYAAIMRRKAKSAGASIAEAQWLEVGRRQLEFLRSHGLRRHHSLLDFGCGALRTGVHLVEFLEPGNYWGVDISSEVLEVGGRLLSERGLEAKRPTLRVVTDLSFEWAEGRTFDFVVAQKVLNHMPGDDVDAFLRNVRKVMTAESVVIASFIHGAVTDARRARFHYRTEALEALAKERGYRPEIVWSRRRGRQLKLSPIPSTPGAPGASGTT